MGNQAVPIYRNITVRDTTKPTIFLRGGPEVLIEATVPYEDQGAYWADTVDGYASIEANGTLDIYTPGVYTLTYGYTDTSNVGDPVSGSLRSLIQPLQPYHERAGGDAASCS